MSATREDLDGTYENEAHVGEWRCFSAACALAAAAIVALSLTGCPPPIPAAAPHARAAASAAPVISSTWEVVTDQGGAWACSRTRVPDGWLVTTREGALFIHDPEGTWLPPQIEKEK